MGGELRGQGSEVRARHPHPRASPDSAAEQGEDVTLNPPAVDVQGGRLLRALAFSQDQSFIGGFQIGAAKLLDSECISILRALFCWVTAPRDLCKRLLCDLAGLVRCEHSKLA